MSVKRLVICLAHGVQQILAAVVIVGNSNMPISGWGHWPMQSLCHQEATRAAEGLSFMSCRKEFR